MVYGFEEFSRLWSVWFVDLSHTYLFTQDEVVNLHTAK